MLEALQHRAGGLTLVTAAIVPWNTVQIARVLEEMRAEGEAIPKAMLPFPSPLGWRHINLTSDYIWSEGSASPEGGAAVTKSETTPAAA